MKNNKLEYQVRWRRAQETQARTRVYTQRPAAEKFSARLYESGVVELSLMVREVGPWDVIEAL